MPGLHWRSWHYSLPQPVNPAMTLFTPRGSLRSLEPAWSCWKEIAAADSVRPYLTNTTERTNAFEETVGSASWATGWGRGQWGNSVWIPPSQWCHSQSRASTVPINDSVPTLCCRRMAESGRAEEERREGAVRESTLSVSTLLYGYFSCFLPQATQATVISRSGATSQVSRVMPLWRD